MNKRWWAMAAIAAIGVAGCEQKTEKPQATPPVQSAAALELTDDEVPVPQDYVEEATRDVTEANYKTQLDRIEKEIESTPD